MLRRTKPHHAKNHSRCLRVVIIGESGVGKTALIGTYVNGKPPLHLASTIDARLSLKIVNDSLTLHLWDTPGQERLRGQFYSQHSKITLERANTLIVAYDVTNRDSFNQVENHLQEAKQHIASTTQLILIATKTDLAKERVVTFEELQQLARAHDCFYAETSTTNLASLEKVFTKAIQYWHPRLEPEESTDRAPKNASFLRNHRLAFMIMLMMLSFATIGALTLSSAATNVFAFLSTHSTLGLLMAGMCCICASSAAIFYYARGHSQTNQITNPKRPAGSYVRFMEEGVISRPGERQQINSTTAPTHLNDRNDTLSNIAEVNTPSPLIAHQRHRP